jgi:hypothetical protein
MLIYRLTPLKPTGVLGVYPGYDETDWSFTVVRIGNPISIQKNTDLLFKISEGLKNELIGLSTAIRIITIL